MINKKISICTTLYSSEDYILEFYERAKKEIADSFEEYEFIFVNDGSPDNSVRIVEEICDKDLNVKLIDFSRNFGHHKALMTSIQYSSGDYVYLTDVDLEEKPEDFQQFWDEMKSSLDVDMIYATQQTRKGSFFEKISGDVFYWAFEKLSTVKVPRNIVTTRLMTKRYASALTQFKEHEIFIAGLAVLAGFGAREVKISKLSHSPSSYSLGKRLALLINGVSSFSEKPLYMIFWMGLGVLFFSLLFSLYVLYGKFFLSTTITGWTSLMLVMLFCSGFIIFSLGIISIYLSKIFIESKNRPYVVVKNVINHEK